MAYEYDNLPTPLPEYSPNTVFTTSMTHQLHCLVGRSSSVFQISLYSYAYAIHNTDQLYSTPSSKPTPPSKPEKPSALARKLRGTFRIALTT